MSTRTRYSSTVLYESTTVQYLIKGYSTVSLSKVHTYRMVPPTVLTFRAVVELHSQD